MNPSGNSRGIRPTLLAVSPVSPWPASDGMTLRVSRLLEELAGRWSIVLVCPSGGESAAANGPFAGEFRFARKGQWMCFPSPRDAGPVLHSVAEAIRAHRPTVAILWGGMEYLHTIFPEMPSAISDRVDSMTLSAWRLLLRARGFAARRRQVIDLFYAARYEFRVRRLSSATVVVGEEDARVLRRVVGVKNVQVIPNGVDVPAAVANSRASRPTVAFTGVLSYQPNIDAVMHFAEDIWPEVLARIPGAVFQIVGRNPGPAVVALGLRPGVEVYADVESVQDFLARAWLAVAPMLTGAGLKNKVLEAWSVGTPAVMTPIATNGLEGAPPALLLTAEGRQLSALVVDLLSAPERLAELGALARATARECFTWESKGAAFHALLQSLAPSKGVESGING
jgi:glycosyltransferase involved in cell wall biosynthesis